jgi:hypothetical protein
MVLLFELFDFGGGGGGIVRLAGGGGILLLEIIDLGGDSRGGC